MGCIHNVIPFLPPQTLILSYISSPARLSLPTEWHGARVSITPPGDITLKHSGPKIVLLFFFFLFPFLRGLFPQLSWRVIGRALGVTLSARRSHPRRHEKKHTTVQRLRKFALEKKTPL